MKLLTTFLLISLLSLGNSQKSIEKATCYGKSSCRACKNCKYCKYCAKDDGTCGVCR